MGNGGVVRQIEQVTEDVIKRSQCPHNPCTYGESVLTAVKRELADHMAMRSKVEEERLESIYNLIVKLGTKIDGFGKAFTALPCQAGTKKKGRK